MSVPSDEILERELRAAVRELLDQEIEITINKVRQRAEEKLNLPDSFFKDTSEWKNRSKDIIHGAINTDGSDDGTKQEEEDIKPVKKMATKRQSIEEPEQKPKRVKKEPASKKAAVKKAPAKKAAPKKKKVASPESELSNLDDSEEEGTSKSRGKKTAKKVESESELSDIIDSEEEEKPKKRGKKSASEIKSESELSDLESEEEVKPEKKAVVKGRAAKSAPSDDDKEDIKSDPDSFTSRKRKRPTKPTKVESDNDEDMKDAGLNKTKTEGSEEDEKPRIDPKEEKDIKPTVEDDSSELSSVVDDAPPKKKTGEKEEAKPEVDDDSSDLSSVIDDGPPKKRKTKNAKGSKPPPKPKAAKAAAKEPSGDEAEIKKLQSQLVKCGVRKIWGFELKEFGDDNRGKLRHLKKMLNDIGMTGRFSEARAKEIKEQRELLADLDAVQEMNDLWGSSGRGGRASRSKAKAPTKEESEGEEEAADAKPRVSKRQADLAFLGSESESD